MQDSQTAPYLRRDPAEMVPSSWIMRLGKPPFQNHEGGLLVSSGKRHRGHVVVLRNHVHKILYAL
jgi:hypothetical protein